MHICTGIKNRAFAEVGVSRFTFPFLYLPFRCFLYNFFLLLASVHLANAVAMQNVSELKKKMSAKEQYQKIYAQQKTTTGTQKFIFFAITLRGNFGSSSGSPFPWDSPHAG